MSEQSYCQIQCRRNSIAHKINTRNVTQYSKDVKNLKKQLSSPPLKQCISFFFIFFPPPLKNKRAAVPLWFVYYRTITLTSEKSNDKIHANQGLCSLETLQGNQGLNHNSTLTILNQYCAQGRRPGGQCCHGNVSAQVSHSVALRQARRGEARSVAFWERRRIATHRAPGAHRS